MIHRFIPGLTLALWSLSLALPAAAGDAPSGDMAAGRAIAENRCGACHATGPSGDSPMAEAPHFRDLGRHYPVENLAEALAEGMVAGHPGMPTEPWDPQDIDPFLAYLKSLQASSSTGP
jgi:mono/diheme cytochrome c family protein